MNADNSSTIETIRDKEVEMPRPLSPLPDDGGPVSAFAADLRKLRDGVHDGAASLESIARQTLVGKSTLHAAFSGKRLPSRRVLAILVRAFDGDIAHWIGKLSTAEGERSRRQMQQMDINFAVNGAAAPSFTTGDGPDDPVLLLVKLDRLAELHFSFAGAFKRYVLAIAHARGASRQESIPITAAHMQSLCYIYDMTPVALAEVIQGWNVVEGGAPLHEEDFPFRYDPVEARPRVTLRLDKLRTLPNHIGGPLTRYVTAIQEGRGNTAQIDSVRVATDDLRSLAVIYDLSPDDFVEKLASWGVISEKVIFLLDDRST